MTTVIPDSPHRSFSDAPTQWIMGLTQEFRLRRSLRLQDQEPEGSRHDWPALGVALAATAVSVAACVYFYRMHRLLGYQDSFSHLEISRRVLSGRTKGIAQLGSIWLPVPHMLQATLAWNWTLYSTGLAGAIVSMLAFVASTTLIYKIVRVFSPARMWPAIAGASVFMLNPNMLYQQSTSMDELPFYAFALAATYFLIRWADTRKGSHLLRASLASMVAMMCRYEGWFLAGIFLIAVLVMARRTGHSWRDTRGLAGTFAAFGVLTASLGWLLYNWAVAGSPVNFLFGANSSADQMSKRHSDVEIGSWPRTLHAYGNALVDDHGLIVLAAAALGLIVFLAAERLSARSLPIVALAAVVPFYVATIEGGQEPIGVPPVNPSLLNLRFGLVALLPAALVIGYLVARLPRRIVTAAGVVAVLGMAVLSANAFRQHDLVTVQEASDELATWNDEAAIGDFLVRNTTGPIMLNLVGNERVAFPVLDRVIYEGTKSGRSNVWHQALRDPRSVGAHTVLMRHSVKYGLDDVYKALNGSPAMAAYHVVLQTADFTVYEANA